MQQCNYVPYLPYLPPPIFPSISGMGLAKDVFVATPEDLKVYGPCVGTIASIALREGRTLYEHSG
jgi:hypothetical protein